MPATFVGCVCPDKNGLNVARTGEIVSEARNNQGDRFHELARRFITVDSIFSEASIGKS